MPSSPDLFDRLPPPGDDTGEVVLNVFEHQRFRVRRADGTRLTRSFREIVTTTADDGAQLGDEALALDYPQEFFNVAALSLMAALAQRLFEPATPAALADRLDAPVAPAEFDAKIRDLRRHYALVGPGPRFMQGPEAPPKKTSGPIADALFLTYSKPGASQNDKRFLYRADADWGVAPEQAALLLYARNTFYEGQGGGGPDPYFKGVTGNTPVRSLVTVPADGDTLDLRRTVWLNVLSRSAQQTIQGAFPAPGTGYDGRFWEDPPPDGNVPLGRITLAAGLFWMTAHHRLHFEPVGDAPAVCVVTGEPILSGLVARSVTKWSTRTAFNKGDKANKGKRAEGLFRHPNVPTWRRYDRETKDYGPEQMYAVHRQTGLVDALGGAVFGAGPQDTGKGRHAAPAVQQTLARAIQERSLPLRTLVFGFHMLGDQTTHGAFERDELPLSIAGDDPDRTLTQLDAAAEVVEQAGRDAHRMADRLRKATHETVGLSLRAKPDQGGHVVYEHVGEPDWKALAEAKVLARDVLADYWRGVQRATHALVADLARRAATADGLNDAARAPLQAEWRRTVRRLARNLYRPVFERHAVARRTMPYAHVACLRHFPELISLPAAKVGDE